MSLILKPEEIKGAMGNISDKLMLETMCIGGEIAAKAQARHMGEGIIKMFRERRFISESEMQELIEWFTYEGVL